MMSSGVTGRMIPKPIVSTRTVVRMNASAWALDLLGRSERGDGGGGGGWVVELLVMQRVAA
jgi:hypothetical protein